MKNNTATQTYRMYLDLKISPLPDNKYLVREDMEVSGILIPEGYVTNGADIPRFLWWLIPPNRASAMVAVCVHDYLCDKVKIKNNEGLTDSKTLQTGFEMADLVFQEILLLSITSKTQRNLYYMGVSMYTKFIRPWKIGKPMYIYPRNVRLLNKKGQT